MRTPGVVQRISTANLNSTWSKTSASNDFQTGKPNSFIVRKGLKRVGFGLGYLAVALLGAIAFLKTAAFHVAVDRGLEALNLAPPARSLTNTETENNQTKFDSAFKGITGFNMLENFLTERLNLKNYDLNHNGILLDTEEEINFLRQDLLKDNTNIGRTNSASSLITTLNELNEVKRIVWGTERNHKNTIQAERPNCQVMGGLQAHYLTEEHFQNLKHFLKVTDYNLSEDNFYINFEVTLGNETIPVKHEDIVKWMSQKGIEQSRDKEGALAIPALTLALEKKLADYDGVPPTFPTSVPNLLTGRSHVLLGISPFTVNTMADNQLATILKSAPEHQVLAVSWGQITGINDWWSRNRDSFHFNPISPEKASEFKASVINRAKQIKEELTNGKATEDITSSESQKPDSKPNNTQTQAAPITFTSLIASQQPNTGNTNPVTPNIEGTHAIILQNPVNITTGTKTAEVTQPYSEYFPENHLYVVKDYDETTGLITVIDSHGTNYKPLTLNEFREKMGGVIIESKDSPLFNTWEVVPLYLLTLLSFYAAKKASTKLERKVNYGFSMGDLIKEYFEKANPTVTKDEIKPETSEQERELYKVLTIALVKAAIENVGIDEEYMRVRPSSMDINKLADYLGLGYWYTEQIIDLVMKDRKDFEEIPLLGIREAKEVRRELLKAA